VEPEADERVDLGGAVVTPGPVNLLDAEVRVGLGVDPVAALVLIAQEHCRHAQKFAA
jgi:hypothetical protein